MNKKEPEVEQPELLDNYDELYSSESPKSVDTILDSMIVEPSSEENIVDPVVTVAVNSTPTPTPTSSKTIPISEVVSSKV